MLDSSSTLSFIINTKGMKNNNRRTFKVLSIWKIKLLPRPFGKNPRLIAEEASHYNANVSRATFKRFNVSIFFAKLSTIIYLTNQTMIPESGITRQRQSKNVHRLPFFLSRPHTALFFFSPYTPLGSLFTVTDKYL